MQKSWRLLKNKTYLSIIHFEAFIKPAVIMSLYDASIKVSFSGISKLVERTKPDWDYNCAVIWINLLVSKDAKMIYLFVCVFYIPLQSLGCLLVFKQNRWLVVRLCVNWAQTLLKLTWPSHQVCRTESRPLISRRQRFRINSDTGIWLLDLEG